MGWTPGTSANVQPWQYSLPDANGDTRRAQMCIRGNTPCLVPTGTPDVRKCAAVAILLAWCQRGRQTGANVRPLQYYLPGANGDARRAQMCSRGNTPCLVPTGHQTGAKTKNGLQIFCRPGTAKTFYIIHYILQIPDRLPDI